MAEMFCGMSIILLFMLLFFIVVPITFERKDCECRKCKCHYASSDDGCEIACNGFEPMDKVNG